MAVTPKFGLTMMSTSMSGKETVFNEATLLLEALASGVVKGRFNTPATGVADGDLYIIGPSPSGVWTGQAGKLALYYNGWRIFMPVNKMTVWNETAAAFFRYNGATWDQIPASVVATLTDLNDVAIVTPSNGQIIQYDGADNQWKNVTRTLATDLGALDDVDLVTVVPVDGSLLTYDETLELWVPKSPADSGITLSGLADVDAAGRADGQILIWDEEDGKHKYGSPTYIATVSSINDIGDVVLSGLETGDVLSYNGAAWVPGSPIGLIASANDIAGGFSGEGGRFLRVAQDELLIEYSDVRMEELGNVQISSLANGQILQYDSALQKWKNITAVFGAAVSDWKNSVKVALDTNVSLGGIDSGSVHQGITLNTGDRVLLFGQTNATQNGIYVVPNSGTASRALDANTSELVTTGLTAYVERGTFAGKFYFLTTIGTINLGSTNLTFVELSLTGGLGIPTGGTTGQVLAKASNMNGDMTWANTVASDIGLSCYAEGLPVSNEILIRVPVVRPFDLTSFVNCRAIANTGAAGTAACTLLKNGVSFGTITFNGSATGVFAGAGTTFALGDILTIMAPAVQDLTLADIGISLRGVAL